MNLAVINNGKLFGALDRAYKRDTEGIKILPETAKPLPAIQ